MADATGEAKQPPSTVLRQAVYRRLAGYGSPATRHARDRRS
jgi:hypothetical protein